DRQHRHERRARRERGWGDFALRDELAALSEDLDAVAAAVGHVEQPIPGAGDAVHRRELTDCGCGSRDRLTACGAGATTTRVPSALAAATAGCTATTTSASSTAATPSTRRRVYRRLSV